MSEQPALTLRTHGQAGASVQTPAGFRRLVVRLTQARVQQLASAAVPEDLASTLLCAAALREGGTGEDEPY